MMVIITGASSGIGQFLLGHFEKSQQVYGTYNSSNNPDSRLSKVDVRNYEEVDSWRTSLDLDKSSQIILINCAGISYSSFAHKADITSWQNVINTNLIGTFNVIRSFLPVMREAEFGRIINLGSIVAQSGVPGTSSYAASKAALWGLAKSLAVENAAKHVTINNINLGYCDIGMGLTQISEKQRVDLMSRIPARRFGSAEEITKTIEYFITTEYVNGTSVDLNGALF
jgi:NAD(P)-dependent dehydrogenase (short-subunit alcohol dehydrogenase family)